MLRTMELRKAALARLRHDSRSNQVAPEQLGNERSYLSAAPAQTYAPAQVVPAGLAPKFQALRDQAHLQPAQQAPQHAVLEGGPREDQAGSSNAEARAQQATQQVVDSASSAADDAQRLTSVTLPASQHGSPPLGYPIDGNSAAEASSSGGEAAAQQQRSANPEAPQTSLHEDADISVPESAQPQPHTADGLSSSDHAVAPSPPVTDAADRGLQWRADGEPQEPPPVSTAPGGERPAPESAPRLQPHAQPTADAAPVPAVPGGGFPMQPPRNRYTDSDTSPPSSPGPRQPEQTQL